MIHFSHLTSREVEKVLDFDEFYKVYPARRDEIERAIRDQSAYSMKVENDIVGYAIFRSYGFLESSFVHLLIVDPHYRGKGYAQEFMKYFESLAISNRIHTSTNESNIPMQNLLQKLGYTEGGRLISFDPDDPEIFYFKKIE